MILIVAFLLRLFYALGQDHLVVYADAGGDSRWYLANGYALFTGFDNGILPLPGGSELPIGLKNLPTPPLYLLLLGFWQALLAPDAAILAIRLLQVVLATATIYLAFRLGRMVGDTRAGLLTAAILAISPVFVLEPAQIATETVYIFLLAAALTIYVENVSASSLRYPIRSVAVTGFLLGLATLTRAVLLLFPLGLVLHLLLVHGWRRGLRWSVILLLVYSAVVGSWTVYNLARWDRFVIGGEGFAAFFYIGATDAGWQGGAAVDEGLNTDLPAESNDQQEIYRDQAEVIISSDPLGYVTRRVRELASAYLLPHGTLLFSGESLRNLVQNWLRDDRSLSGLITVTQADAFWPKLLLYVFHFTGIFAGLIGMWLTRERWQVTLSLMGFILYTTLIHLLLTALPRYIFPTELFWWVFAGVTLVSLSRFFKKDELREI